jgi:site-specific DNA-cytosine methylase
MINASLVSAQTRKRLFWTNIPVTKLPEDRNIFVKDILLSGEHVIVTNQTQYKPGGDKTQTLLARDYKGFGNQAMSGVKVENNIRKLDPIECERLQGLPDNYTECISNTQRYKCLGNAFNVDVICHILNFIKEI